MITYYGKIRRTPSILFKHRTYPSKTSSFFSWSFKILSSIVFSMTNLTILYMKIMSGNSKWKDWPSCFSINFSVYYVSNLVLECKKQHLIGLYCPIRWILSWAWRSTAGFHQGSIRKTWAFPYKMKPSEKTQLKNDQKEIKRCIWLLSHSTLNVLNGKAITFNRASQLRDKLSSLKQRLLKLDHTLEF